MILVLQLLNKEKGWGSGLGSLKFELVVAGVRVLSANYKTTELLTNWGLS